MWKFFFVVQMWKSFSWKRNESKKNYIEKGKEIWNLNKVKWIDECGAVVRNTSEYLRTVYEHKWIDLKTLGIWMKRSCLHTFEWVSLQFIDYQFHLFLMFIHSSIFYTFLKNFSFLLFFLFFETGSVLQ